jgi:succinate dehydrogenase/fumarate reductase iron-sulfur protein
MDSDRRDVLRVSVARSDPEAMQQFEVARFAHMTVLDVLLTIQREHDASLGFRFSCRVAMCGTCTLRVDGRSVLACQTVVQDEAATMDIRPMAGFSVLRDLVVDFTPFWDEWQRIIPYLVPVGSLDEPAQVAPDSEERNIIDPSLDCIQCGACFSSCGIAGLDHGFIGPAALNRAMVLVNDSRDAAGRRRLDVVTGSGGVDRCRYIYGCTAVCPKGLDPAQSIRHLRTGRTTDR